jgi:hypothetical protein
MPDPRDTPSIVDRPITRFRGRTLRYTDLSALEKCDYLFDEGVRATAYTGDLPDVHLGVLQFAEAAITSVAHGLLDETLTRQSDELEEPKLKLFHSFGSTARIRFTPSPDTPYTGLFAEQAHGLARFSYAGPVIGIGIVPGLGLKFPIDGEHDSENAVVMRKLDGQARGSVFENAFTNILPTPDVTNVVMQVVRHRFESVVVEGRGLHQPVDNLARRTVAGHIVDAPRVPHRLILVPTPGVRAASDPSIDFREDLARNIRSGTIIYDVYAVDESEPDAELEDLTQGSSKIGALTTESEFIASSYGDHRLFFKHSDVFMRREPSAKL